MAKVIMIQGTMSNVGKSLITAGLCRVFHQDGYRVAPFKAQNMALNSYITKDGLEMGRAQVMQAEAAGIEPQVEMNPILLKPTDDIGSQVIVNGKSIGNMKARDYFVFKKSLLPEIKKAFATLAKENDIIVIEGAGSPAEINLKENDIVNMGMAKLVDAPVLLVGDIDLGGVFAQLLGTLELLEAEERERVKGLVINKFRGDASILMPGIRQLEDKGKVKVLGLVPYASLNLEDEDSQSQRFSKKVSGKIKISVLKFPHISNFTDFATFEQLDEVSINYVTRPRELEGSDLIILPGSKNTLADLQWAREAGFEEELCNARQSGLPIIGICGGFQMLGRVIEDPDHTESNLDKLTGFGFLPLSTRMGKEKETRQYHGKIRNGGWLFAGLENAEVSGYEIHMGKTRPIADMDFQQENFEESGREKSGEIMDASSRTERLEEFTDAASGYFLGNVYGTYVHGIFDQKEIARTLVENLAGKKGLEISTDSLLNYQDFKEKEYDKLADIIRSSFHMEEIYGILREAKLS